MFDAAGQSYGPTFTTKNGKRYRYYVEQRLRRSGSGTRIPAFEIESLVEKTIRKHLYIHKDAPAYEVFKAVKRVEMHSKELLITLHPDDIIPVPYEMDRTRHGAIVIRPNNPARDMFDLPAPELKKLIQGFVWRDEHFGGLTIRQIAQREKVSDSFVGKQIFRTFEIL